MAGKEVSGAANADAALFNRRFGCSLNSPTIRWEKNGDPG
jgi:hypothetical protein